MVVCGNFSLSRIRSTGDVDAHNSTEVGSRENILESAGAGGATTSWGRSGDSTDACSWRWCDNGACCDESNSA